MKKIEFKSFSPWKWTKLALWTIFLLLFAIWTESFWAFFVPFLFLLDAYFTRFINWRWWEGGGAFLRYTMKWIEDIVVVLALIHLLNIFVFQQFKIPTSSLEKTCLVGDHLFVSKLSYGPRIPMTPIAFPLVHNAFPWGGKSYLDRPQWSYRRIKGLGSVERGDIVVFNFPTGDTVPLRIMNPDYYTLLKQYGRETVWGDKETFGEIVYRPVDMREHYVKRCVGMPGDSLEIRANALYINGKRASDPEHLQLNYFVQVAGQGLSSEEMESLSIAVDDRLFLPGDHSSYFSLWQKLGLDTLSQGNYGMMYHFPLTLEAKKALEAHPMVRAVVVEPTPSQQDFPVYPLWMETTWTRDDYGPIYIPRKGATVRLTPQNLPLYERCIRNYEGHQLLLKEGRIYIDGMATDTYTFSMDYYFMMGDNRHNSADSRAWGFVPEDHVVGKPLLVWLSLDKDKGLFNGKIRWSRFFTRPE